MTKWSSTTETTVYVYTTVEPNTIIIPIVSWIFGFPVLALLIICYLRRRAKLARERARQSNCDFENQVNLSLTRGDGFTEAPTNRLVEHSLQWI